MDNTSFGMTDAAANRILKITHDEPSGTRLRIAVKGGGCSGFQYEYLFDAAEPAPDDKVVSLNNAEIIIDTTSLELLAGSELDYVETLGSAGFELRNPNAKASCGCGNSFSL